MKNCVLIFGFSLYACSALAGELVSGMLARGLKDLYVTHKTVAVANSGEERYLEIFLTMNSYQGDLRVGDVVSNKVKYTIYIADANLKILRSADFFFGGPEQYAVKISGNQYPMVGRVGEYVRTGAINAYAGLRADPAFYDKEGYRGFLKKRCLPVKGLRCEDAGDVKNFFQNKNVLGLALSLPIKDLAAAASEAPTKFFVWAKAFKIND